MQDKEVYVRDEFVVVIQFHFEQDTVRFFHDLVDMLNAMNSLLSEWSEVSEVSERRIKKEEDIICCKDIRFVWFNKLTS